MAIAAPAASLLAVLAEILIIIGAIANTAIYASPGATARVIAAIASFAILCFYLTVTTPAINKLAAFPTAILPIWRRIFNTASYIIGGVAIFAAI